MAERKSISKKMRFEVFKRDSFTCQYCGRHAPDVVLECDHIKPVADGGKNTMLNLVTSCRDCNRGKGKRPLSEKTEVDKQFDRMAELNEKREQFRMLLKWREELVSFENEQIDLISDAICDKGRCLSDAGRQKVRMLIKRFGFDAVLEASEISHNKYMVDQDLGFSYAFDKIGGICYNKAHGIRGGKNGY